MQHPILATAVRAARRAGDIISRYVDRVPELTVTAKTRNDFVTEVDRAAEEAIVETIRRAYPRHGILAEEGTVAKGDEYQWIIDPLDGTTNFIHGMPQVGVSIGIRYYNRLEYAVVYDPLRNELFTAQRGGGAHLNERRIRVTALKSLEGGLIGTGFPFKEFSYLDDYLACFKAIAPKVAGIRRPGSAALDLAYVAAGRYDGFWEFYLKPWDIAAGILLIQEAGGIVTDFHGEQGYLESGNIVAGTPRVHAQMLGIIQEAIAKP